jgi:hypothetical protein
MFRQPRLTLSVVLSSERLIAFERSSKEQPVSKRKRDEAELDEQIDALLESHRPDGSDDEEGEVDDLLGSEDES